MTSLTTTPRSLLPRLNLLLRPSTRVINPSTLRNASSSSSSGLSEEFRRRQAAKQPKLTPVMPQPDKYRPPSHSARLPNKNLENRIYGPALTEEDKKRMATKKYPNMMSPEGSWSHWFINHATLHMWMTLGVLFALAWVAMWLEFRHRTIYGELLPSRKELLRHPIASCRQFWDVYKLHVNEESRKTHDARMKKHEDIQRRKAFRYEREMEAEEKGEEYIVDSRYWVGDDGVRRRRVKRWFGIWE